MMSLSALIGLLVDVAIAQSPPAIPCSGLPGCGGGGAANVLTETFLPGLGQIMLSVAGGLAVLFVVVAGFQIFLAQGDDGKYSAGKQAIVFALGGLAFVGLSQMFVGLIVTEVGVGQMVDEISVIAGFVRILVNIMNGVFFVVIGYAGIQMLVAQGRTEKYEQARGIISQAIIGAIIVNLAHAFVRIVTSYLGI